MINEHIISLLVIIVLTTTTWLVSLYKKDVSIVDSMWSIMILSACLVYIDIDVPIDLKSQLIVFLVTVWALRLSVHLTIRNWGEPEDQRYVQIRNKYRPHFAIKSLFIIFIFQALLAWVVSLPLNAALGITTFRWIDTAALLLWATGMFFESVADYQLTRFKRDPANKGKVMSSGLWRYSRHPNYFGEFLIWWGYYLFAVNSDTWWTVISPLLMTWLLLKFSGVTLMESDISTRRPDYKNYTKETNAFFPGPRKSTDHNDATKENL